MKSKKILTILLSLAIMFTFMPFTAFADTSAKKVTWSGYDSVTVSGCTGSDAIYNGTYETVKAFQTADGTVKVDVKDPKIGGVDYATLKTIVGSKSYYDLNNAAFAYDNGSTQVALYDSYASVSAWNSGQPNGILFTAPTGTYTVTTAPTFFVAAVAGTVTLDQWNGTITLDPTTLTDKGEDMTVKVSADVTWSSGTQTIGIVGSLADKTVTVKAAAKGTVPSSLAGQLYVDDSTTAETTAAISKSYDGKEHTITAAPVKGYTLKYTVFNAKTGNWDEVKAVTFKDKAATVSARVTYYDDSVANDPGTVRTFTVAVSASGNAPSIKWNTDAGVPSAFVVGQYDPWDYVDVTGAEVTADEDALLAYFKAAYKVKETATSKFDSTKYSWTFEAVSPAPKAADYPILANYAAPTAPTGTKAVTIYEVAPDPDSEISFTKTVTSKTYKGSKTTKAGKLKKNQSFTVHAEASNGLTVAYKLVNAPSKIVIDKETGKITCKKGLAKGTYKIKVKAYIPGSDQWSRSGNVVSETQAITIKVKK